MIRVSISELEGTCPLNLEPPRCLEQKGLEMFYKKTFVFTSKLAYRRTFI